MTDLEMTRLCAEAMGGDTYILLDNGFYDPLHDDAQAMALVKKFSMDILWSWAEQVGCRVVDRSRAHPDDLPDVSCDHKDLNRAICECVAKMQAAKAVQP